VRHHGVPGDDHRVHGGLHHGFRVAHGVHVLRGAGALRVRLPVRSHRRAQRLP
jgi:hypothetical protein